MITITFKVQLLAYKDSNSKFARISASIGSDVRELDRLQNALWQYFDISWIYISPVCGTQSEVFSSAQPHLTHWPGRMLLPRSWTVEQQLLPYQESSCDYCNANQPVITLRACQALDGALWETPFSSMWPHSWQKSHPVTGPHLNSLQQECADWDIHPQAIVPLLISSNRTFSIWAFHRSCCEERTSRSDLKFLREMAFSDVCRSGLQLMMIRRSFFY